jgi:hypothetical protein
MKVGIHRIAVSIYIAGMDAIFDDLSNAIREPRGDAWSAVRAFALDFAGKLLMGVAIGLGVGIGMAIAG